MMKKTNLALFGSMLALMCSCKKAPYQAPEQQLMVTTFSGGGGAGLADGPFGQNSFNLPQSMVTDASGNVYVADFGNNCVRKITPEGVSSTIAGTAEAGYADGTGTAARFNKPYGIAIDAAGNLYVSEHGNNLIRKITPAGVVSIFAGSGSQGFADGSASTAKFSWPSSMAFDAAGNLYVADMINNRIRKINSSGTVSTYAGTGSIENRDGPAATAGIGNPYGLTIDRSGNVYCSVPTRDNGKQTAIRKISTDGMVSTYAGSITDASNNQVGGYVDGFGPSARFSIGRGLAIDDKDNLYVADMENSVIRKITPNRTVSTYAGKFIFRPAYMLPGATGIGGVNSNIKGINVDGLSTEAILWQPSNLTVDKKGNIYVAEGDFLSPGNTLHFIRKISIMDKPVSAEESDRKNWNKPQNW